MPAAAPAPEPGSQEDILAAWEASVAAADIPPDEGDYARWPDPDTGRPAELAGLTGEQLDQLAAAAPAAGPIPAGCLPRDGTGRGPGSPTAARWTRWPPVGAVTWLVRSARLDLAPRAWR